MDWKFKTKSLSGTCRDLHRFGVINHELNLSKTKHFVQF